MQDEMSTGGGSSSTGPSRGLVIAVAILGGAVVAGQVSAQQTSGVMPVLEPFEVRARAWPDASTEGREDYAATQVTVGAKEATPVLAIPHSVSVVTRQRIEDQGLVSAEDALREVTGVTVTPWDGATFQIRSRGYFLEPSYDGVPSFGGLNATQQFDLAMFDRVEVLRGPAGLFQGSGQPGGTVNFARRKGLSVFGGSAAVSVGSWDDYRAEASVGGPLNPDGSLRSRLVVVGHDRDFHYDRAHSRKKMAYGTLDYDLSPRTTLAVYGAFQDHRTNPFSGLPAYSDGRFMDVSRSTNPYPGWSVDETSTAMFATDLEHRWDAGWKLRMRYTHYTQDWRLQDSYPTTGVNPVTGLAPYARRGWDSVGTRQLFDVYVSGPFSFLSRQHALTLGWNYVDYTSETDYGATDTVAGIPVLNPDRVPALDVPPYVRHFEEQTVQSGVYGQARISLTDSVTLVTGARISDYRVRTRNVVGSNPPPAWTKGADESGELTPYSGLVYQPLENLSFYASYSDIFMPQTQREVSGRVLDPRVGRQIEVGSKASFFNGKLQAAIAVFNTRDENRSFADTRNPGYFISVGEVEVEGWEAEVVGSPVPELQMSVGYSRLDTRYLRHATLTGTAFTLFEPKHSFKAYANYRFPQTPWSIGGGVHAVKGLIGGGQAGVREQAGYGVVSLQAGYRIDTRSSLALVVNNLTDRKYYERVGGLNSYNTYGEPRSMQLSYRVTF